MRNRILDRPTIVPISLNSLNLFRLIVPVRNYSEARKAVERLGGHHSKLGFIPEIVPRNLPPILIAAVLSSSTIDDSMFGIAPARVGLTALLLYNCLSTIALRSLIHLISSTKSLQEANEVQAILRNREWTFELVGDKTILTVESWLS
jgi:hypothetical protein